jgi:hypothetical protein
VSVNGVIPNNTVAGNSSAACIVDGVSTAVPLSPNSNQVQTMTEFFHADLEAGMHTLVFNVTELAPSHSIGIDFVLYNSSVHTSSTTQPPVSAPSKRPTRTRIIVGSTLGGLACAVALALLFLLYRRRPRRKTIPPKSESNLDVVSKTSQ